MKIVKRDGRTVEYDSDKIRVAIGKANAEVQESEKISEAEIENIILFIENMGKKRMLVEDIQDIIEEKLMEKGKYHLAKTYIIYRYKRSIIRKSNTIDASILSLLKNGSHEQGVYLDANRQRDVMAGEVSRDLAYRLLLPRNVVEKEQNNFIKFSYVEHFTEPIIESCLLNLDDMFSKGTVINGIKIEPPKSFQSACNILVEIIASVASTQTGDIYVDLSSLFKYYHLSFEKKYSTYETLMKNSLTSDMIRALAQTQSFLEMKSGLQTIFYQINTITIGSGMVPPVYFLIDPECISDEEEEKLVYEFLRQKGDGIKDKDGNLFVPKFPEIIYAMPEGNIEKRFDYITKELLGIASNFLVMSKKRFVNFRKELELFNQGSVTLNLARVALASINESKDFDELLDEVLSVCFEGFLCRNHNLQGIYSDKSPIHWQYGALYRLKSMERIDSVLKKDSSFMKLSVIGFEAAAKILGCSDSDKKALTERIVDTVKKWNKECMYDILISNYSKDAEEMFEKDRDDISKFGIKSYKDSLDFMNDNYFKGQFIYFETEDIIDFLSRDIYEHNIIIKKKSY